MAEQIQAGVSSRVKIIAGNWKMNGSKASVEALCEQLLAQNPNCEVVLCPPNVYLAQVEKLIAKSNWRLGGQNMVAESSGAFTGEVSADMLKDHGCRYVILGHSERRSLYGETSSNVQLKFSAALAAGLKPILCLGETKAERDAGKLETVIREQLQAVLLETGAAAFAGAVVAYEPVWAIGTGDTASPEQAEEVHRLIRNLVAEQDSVIAEGLPILYGGSVNESNAAELFAKPNIDGALVGGASLKAEAFLSICAAAS